MIFNDPVSIPNVLRMMEQTIGSKANKIIVDEGMEYTIPDESFSKYKSKIFANINDQGYTERVIKKYVKSMNNVL